MALTNENSNDHGSYLVAVSALCDSLALASGERIPERRIVEILRHIFRKPYCNKCNCGTGLETAESRLQELLAVEALTGGFLSVSFEVSDGAGDLLVKDPLARIVEFLSERRLRRSGNSLMVTSARVIHDSERQAR